MKTKRYVYEYANDEKRHYKACAKEYPENREFFLRKAEEIDKAVWMVERGYITIPEAMRLISAPIAQ